MASNRVADELLKWGLRHSDGTPASSNQAVAAAAAPSAAGGSSIAAVSADIASGKRPDLADPGLYNAIMGKSEAQMMQEELAVAVDERRSDEDRCTALDNFEMLIEEVDNANNIEAMRMWPPLLALLSSPSPRIQLASAWIVGTAVQNNDKAQMALLAHNPFPALAALLEHAEAAEVRSKAMYALGALLRHNPQAVALWQDECDGWAKLRHALEDPNMVLRRKTAFLLTSLLMQDDEGAAASTSAATPLARSTATGIAPVPSSRAPAPSAAAPLEQGPATARSGVAHPSVTRALLSSGLLRVLACSLLPAPPSAGASGGEEAGAEAWQAVSAAGPDGDQEPRLDADYADKAAHTLLAFAEHAAPLAQNSTLKLDAGDAYVLRKITTELPAQDAGIEEQEWQKFKDRVQILAQTVA